MMINLPPCLTRRAAALATCLSALGTLPAAATFDPTFDAGDLILGFESSASTSFVLEINLGAPGQFKTASSTFLIGNVNSQLTSLFGATWFNDPNLFFGVSGARSNLAIAGSADASGDFNSTAYASRLREGNGILGFANSTPWTIAPSSASTAASGMIQQGNTFNGVAPSGVAVKSIDTTNPNDWADLNPVSGSSQGTAYSTFVGGIQFRFDAGAFDTGSFAGLTNVEGVVDLYRIARFSNGGSTPGVGSYIGSFAIEQDGDVHFVVPEPAAVSMLGLGVASLLGFSRRRHVRA
jgi:hypothetical protein